MYGTVTNQWITSPEACWGMGWQIGMRLQLGDVLTLDGALGSGKTLLTKGIAAAWGITEEITSPSYNIVHEYPGIVSFYHIDLYRVQSIAEIEEIDLLSYFDRQALVVIEWPVLIAAHLPRSTIAVTLQINNDNSRSVTIATINKYNSR